MPKTDVRLAAIALLGRRDYPRAQLRERLLALGFGADPVAATLEDLAAERLLDDARYAAQVVARQARRGQGPRRIREQLQAAGLTPDLIAGALQAGGDWHQLARELRQRRFGPEIPSDWGERARQMRFLQYRGFSNDHMKSALGTSPDSET